MPEQNVFPRTFALIEQGITDGLHFGAQLYVARRGEVAADMAIGEAKPGVPMRPDMITHWLSSVKPVTAVAIAQLIEQGKVALDEAVARYIPEFGNQGKEGITLRHLLTHTGGFRSADKIPEELAWEETIQKICQATLEPGWRPGEKAGYHIGASWFVLGEIVQRIERVPYGQYVRERIFEPLGMQDSWLGVPSTMQERYAGRLAPMYVSDREGLRPHPEWNTPLAMALCRPGSNGRGPIRELGMFYGQLLKAWKGQTGLILKPETIRLFTARHRVGLMDHTFQHRLDWGLGFMVNSNRYGAETVPYGFGRHSSDQVFGHSGAQSSCAFADPDYDLVVAWMCNGLPGERLHQKRARALNTAIYEDLGLGRRENNDE